MRGCQRPHLQPSPPPVAPPSATRSRQRSCLWLQRLEVGEGHGSPPSSGSIDGGASMNDARVRRPPAIAHSRVDRRCLRSRRLSRTTALTPPAVYYFFFLSVRRRLGGNLRCSKCRWCPSAFSKWVSLMGAGWRHFLCFFNLIWIWVIK